MTIPVFELAKVAALSAFIGIFTAIFLPGLVAALVAVGALWLLLARIT